MTKHLFLIIPICVICVLILNLSCNKENAGDCIQTTGNIITQTREVLKFDKIQIEDNINLFISQDSTSGITIEAGENLMPEIITEIHGDTLIIRNDNSCNWVRRFDIPVNMWVNVTDLRNLYIHGYGTISNTGTLELDSFRLDSWESASKVNLTIHANYTNFHMNTGPLDLTASGVTNSCYMYAAGFAVANTSKLETKNMQINSSGTGDFYVHASEILGAEIKSFGNVYYEGNPTQITTKISGSGQLLKIN